MTSKQVFEYALIELNKKEAPSLILEDYNYFINKAVNQYINKIYNAYDINQQKSDDLRVLKSTAVLTPSQNNSYGASDALFSKAYEIDLPDDYLHILNCVIEYNVKSYYKCYNENDKVHFGARRLTADMFSQIINNYYLRPTYKNPYYYINNISTDFDYPITESPVAISPAGTAINNYLLTFGSAGSCDVTITKNGTANAVSYSATPVQPETGDLEFNNIDSFLTVLNFLGIDAIKVGSANIVINNTVEQSVIVTVDSGTFITLNSATVSDTTSMVEKISNYRYGNRSKVRMEVRYGKDTNIFELSKVYIDYLKSPQFIRLSQEEIDKVEDTSQLLEFPDYVCQEIVNELVKLLMENASDPRLQSHIPINQSIAQPQQEQPQQKR